MDMKFNHKTVHKIHKKLKKCLAAEPTFPKGFIDNTKR